MLCLRVQADHSYSVERKRQKLQKRHYNDTVLKQEVWQSPGNETKACLKRLVLASIELRSGFKRRTRLNSATNVIYCKVKDEQTNEITNKMICTAINSPTAQKNPYQHKSSCRT